MDKIEKRPKYEGASVTTPHSNTLLALLGAGMVYEGLAFTNDEWRAIKKLYGYKREKPNQKPPPPEPPHEKDFKTSWDFQDALQKYQKALYAHQDWKDPIELMQAGADRNAIRHAVADGLRMLAWFAKHVESGKDPLKALVQLTADAGWDVSGEDVQWAEDDTEIEV